MRSILDREGVLIEGDEGLREEDEPIGGSAAVMVEREDKKFYKIPWVQTKPIHRRQRGLFRAKKHSDRGDQDFIA